MITQYESFSKYLRLQLQESIIIISIMLKIEQEAPRQSDHLLTYEQIKELVLSTNNFHVLKEYIDYLQNQIQLRKKDVHNEIPSYVRGRGGNNIAQNVKKSLLSVLRKNLPRELFLIFQEQCVKKHGLKSQKQNIFIFFLFLYKFHIQGHISYSLIQKIEQLLKEKMHKYINNSRQKMQIQSGRLEFHNKNIREFEKFLALDLNFRERKTFNLFVDQIKCFYIRKQIEFTKAVRRLSKVVNSDPILKNFFVDQENQEPFFVKEDYMSESSPSSPTASIRE